MQLAGRSTAGGLKLYKYDVANRLIQYADGTTQAEYRYTADGLRASKTINGEKTDFVWNGQNLAAESSTNGINTYTYDMTGIHIANIDGNAQSYLKDMHNNVVGLADENGNKTAVQYTYDAFGRLLHDAPDPFGYCGEYYDSESGLVYLRNRYC